MGKMSIRNINIISLVLLSATLVSFLFLTSSYSSAAPITVSGSSPITASASASVTVASACTFSSTVGGEHSATIPAGTYKSEIGTTTFNIVCNDTEGYSIYAIGYSNQEFGNNKLLANINGTLVSSANINTGTNTSGNPSSWAMKLTPGTGLTASNILNGYGGYSIIPNQYVKVTSLVPATNTTNNTSSLSATYAVNIAGAQPAGTYDGKVKYTMVHPASEVPTQPYNTQAGKIGYYPNASGVVDSMGDQSISNTATSATLWASNFKRSGYGFAGWSDKYDWVINANDENGNGTGVNAGYHIYGPNQTINFTAGQYSGTNKGLSLYAVWVKSQGTIQNWNGCSVMNVGEVTALTDTRDNNTYTVAKLKDEKCWMVENLRLGGTTEMVLDSTTTNIADGTTFTLSATQDPTQAAWCYSDSSSCINKSMIASNNTTNTKDNMTSGHLYNSDSTGIYSMGNYYNWYSATAGTGVSSASNTNAIGDICPRGWKLARGGNNLNSSNSDFRQLAISSIGYDTNGILQNSSFGQYANEANFNKGTEASSVFRAYPLNFTYSGFVHSNILSSRSTVTGGRNLTWTSTAFRSYEAYDLSFSSTHLAPGTSGTDRYAGLPIRCVLDPRF